MMKTSQTGIELILEHEGFSPIMYRDQAGLPTIGYGTLIDTAQEQYLMTATITKEQGMELFKRDLQTFERAVNNAIKVPLKQNQFDALVSLAYNIGIYNFQQSTAVKMINARKSEAEITKWWTAWNKVTINGQKVVSNGLANRRKAEVEYYFSPNFFL